MNGQQAELYQRIRDFPLDDFNAEYSFSRRLAKENSWGDDYTKRVIEEYKKFAFLCAVTNHSVTPSHSVDQAWHLHLIYTDSYWEKFCSQVVGKPLHHHPSRGGKEELEKYIKFYRQTLESYEYFFKQKPPEDIWPSPARRFGVQIDNKLNLNGAKTINFQNNTKQETDNQENLIFQSEDILNNCYSNPK